MEILPKIEAASSGIRPKILPLYNLTIHQFIRLSKVRARAPLIIPLYRAYLSLSATDTLSYMRDIAFNMIAMEINISNSNM